MKEITGPVYNQLMENLQVNHPDLYKRALAAVISIPDNYREWDAIISSDNMSKEERELIKRLIKSI